MQYMKKLIHMPASKWRASFFSSAIRCPPFWSDVRSLCTQNCMHAIRAHEREACPLPLKPLQSNSIPFLV